MGSKRKDETEEQYRVRWSAYMRDWSAKKKAEILAAPKKLCQCGCGYPILSVYKNAKFAPGHWTLGREFGNTKCATISPTLRQIEWAAGFLEGEGSFTSSSGSKGYPTCRVQAGQVQKEPLEQLHRMFGGTLICRERKEFMSPSNGKIYKANSDWFWWCHQTRARGIMMTIYSLMSPRRQEQIRNCFSKWQRNGHATAWQRKREREAMIKNPVAVDATFGKEG